MRVWFSLEARVLGVMVDVFWACSTRMPRGIPSPFLWRMAEYHVVLTWRWRVADSCICLKEHCSVSDLFLLQLGFAQEYAFGKDRSSGGPVESHLWYCWYMSRKPWRCGAHLMVFFNLIGTGYCPCFYSGDCSILQKLLLAEVCSDLQKDLVWSAVNSDESATACDYLVLQLCFSENISI